MEGVDTVLGNLNYLIVLLETVYQSTCHLAKVSVYGHHAQSGRLIVKHISDLAVLLIYLGSLIFSQLSA